MHKLLAEKRLTQTLPITQTNLTTYDTFWPITQLHIQILHAKIAYIYFPNHAIMTFSQSIYIRQPTPMHLHHCVAWFAVF